MEYPVIAAFASMAIAACTIITFWINFATQISNARSIAEQAKTSADDARKTCIELNASLAATGAAFALYREQIAREYIHRETMREVEERLTNEIKEVAKRIDRFLVLAPYVRQAHQE